ncbi:hypothetical protein TGDOM2_306710 [Toxoplasma gondii GAB2-2007-GAL-DOM2]|uniref:Uncharacterized protein n=3 Tax=Toxoplasma gondii TaxID=5811 RepID=S7UIJ1_TOXGG|nr:hypothetical protein TGGT1_306710 [Toxoplasma gondii GT1]KFG33684.1 hypothetical protein TGDOM2_306710 [Toxoplasma gondii GAB2-2007-GAL-DOM2]KFG44713.1 hypothetical protein TGFOU_306710 [Toxoplasma gondii FOU]
MDIPVGLDRFLFSIQFQETTSQKVLMDTAIDGDHHQQCSGNWRSTRQPCKVHLPCGEQADRDNVNHMAFSGTSEAGFVMEDVATIAVR